jgi:hypothetical protein
MGDRVVNEFVALFVFLKGAVQGGEREKGKERKKKMWRRGKRGKLTSVVTSRLRYSIQTRIGEFIGPGFLCYRYDGNLRASKARIGGLGAKRRRRRVLLYAKMTSEGQRKGSTANDGRYGSCTRRLWLRLSALDDASE